MNQCRGKSNVFPVRASIGAGRGGGEGRGGEAFLVPVKLTKCGKGQTNMSDNRRWCTVCRHGVYDTDTVYVLYY